MSLCGSRSKKNETYMTFIIFKQKIKSLFLHYYVKLFQTNYGHVLLYPLLEYRALKKKKKFCIS